MFDRRLILNFDIVLFCTVLLICAAGVLNLNSICSSVGEATASFYYKQICWIVFGLLCIVCIININYTSIVRYGYHLHACAVFLLLLVLVIGKIKLGSQRWISIGGISLQPSELVKITFILALAKFYSENISQKPYTLRDILYPVLLLISTFVPICLQPDLGTAGIVFLVFCAFLFFLNLNKKSFYPFFALILCGMPFCWFFLREYQKQRILIFLNPDLDPLRAGYQIIQSKIAVGSGGILGKGFKMGTQSQLRFLPEQHTDFVFSVWAEEWGFVGCCIVLLLYFFLIYRALTIAFNAKNFYGSFLAIGISFLFFIQFFINICMTIGLFPVVGVPLPLMSYGGSSIISCLIGIGLLLNIGMRKFK